MINGDKILSYFCICVSLGQQCPSEGYFLNYYLFYLEKNQDLTKYKRLSS